MAVAGYEAGMPISAYMDVFTASAMVISPQQSWQFLILFRVGIDGNY